MQTTDSIEQLYQMLKLKLGSRKAKSAVAAIVSNSIDDLEQEGIEVSAESLSSKINEKISDFNEVLKNQVA